jgi:hypothetical protein
MKSLLTVRLISALNEPQHTLVLQKLKVEKRNSLFVLYKLLAIKKEEETIDKSTIFFKVFKKKWTKEADYLLRNELKLLKDKIEEIIIESKLKQYQSTIEDKIKLDFYRDLKMTDEFSNLYNQFMKKNEGNFGLDNYLDYSFIYADFIRLNVSNYAERAILLEENLKNFEAKLNLKYTVDLSKFNLMKSHVLFQQKQKHNVEIGELFSYKKVDIETVNYRNELSDYFISYANAYKNFDTSTIEEWEETFQLLKKVPKDYEQYPDEYCFTLGNLATICSIRSDFEKADKYFEQLFSELEDSIIYQNRALILNYITNLNKLKRYKKASIELSKASLVFGEKIREFSQFKTQEIVVACFLNDIAGLGKLLAINFETLQPFEKIYYRLFYCIYFLLQNNYELAFIEIQNLQRSKLMNEVDSHFGLVANFFYVCIRHANNYGSINKLSRKDNAEIELNYNLILEANIPMFLNYSPFLWMKDWVGLS